MACEICGDTGWVCEDHPDKPWEGPRACGCGGAGKPCPACNTPAPGARPRIEPGFIPHLDRDKGSVH